MVPIPIFRARLSLLAARSALVPDHYYYLCISILILGADRKEVLSSFPALFAHFGRYDYY